MKNIDVIQKFVFNYGKEKSKTQHLYIDTQNKYLINYNTIIAEWNGTDDQTKEIVINCNRYSTTTSKIQSAIIKAIKQARHNGYNFFVVLTGEEQQVEKYSKLLKAE